MSGGWLDDSSVYSGGNLRNRVVDVSVELDGQPDYYIMKVNSLLSSPFNSSLNLVDLEEGEHSVLVHVSCEGVILNLLEGSERSIRYSVSSATRYFRLDTTAPTVSILSVENRMYENSDFLLEFAVDELGLNLMYCLDGGENVTLAGNATVMKLEYGAHMLTVFAEDDAGNVGVSETVYFSVAQSFPETLLAVAVVAAMVVNTGLLFYFRKRRHRESSLVQG